MKDLIVVMSVGLLTNVAPAAGPRLSEVAAAGDRSVVVRTIRYSPPLVDFTSSEDAKWAANEGGSTEARVYKFKIPDPAYEIADSLCAHLKSNFGFGDPAPFRVILKSEHPDEIVRTVGISKGFILDVQNVAWSTHTAPGGNREYLMTYTVRIRLIDASTRRVVRTGEFPLRAAPMGTYRRYGERSLDDGAIIRDDLRRIASEGVARVCEKTLSEDG